jgi:hypothetical protein
MPRHDTIFKALLRTFFADLLWLVVPDLAGHLDLRHPVFLDKEFFTVEGQRRELDLLVRVSFLGENRESLLIHVEVEARATPAMGRRLWLYRHQIQAVHSSRILSIALYLHRGRTGIQAPALFEEAPIPSLETFRYISFGLAGCDAAEYLLRPEPLAWSLAALMRPGALTRPALKLACLHRIAIADLDDARRILLVDCVETYLELNSDEAAEYARLYTVRENREMRTMATTWSERMTAQGREQGREEGIQAVKRILLGLLEQRFGPLPAATRERIEAISSLDRLTRLSEKALTARSLATLRLH